jgi:hypothetical protein
MSSTIRGKTGTSFINTEARMSGKHLQYICDIFGVKEVIHLPYKLTKEYKAELFLLGASFSTEVINGTYCDIMIHNNRLCILDIIGGTYGKFT